MTEQEKTNQVGYAPAASRHLHNEPDIVQAAADAYAAITRIEGGDDPVNDRIGALANVAQAAHDSILSILDKEHRHG